MEAGKSKNKVLADSVPSDSPLPGSQMLAFSLHPPVRQEKEKWEEEEEEEGESGSENVRKTAREKERRERERALLSLLFL